MIDFRIADVVEHTMQVEWRQRIGALALLLPVKLELLELATSSRHLEFFHEGGFVLLVAVAVFLLCFLDLVPLVHRAGKVTRHFDVDGGRRAVASNQGVHHLARLVERA